MYSLGGSKIKYLRKSVFDQLLNFQILLLLFLHSLLLCHILLFGCWLFPIPCGCQTIWIRIRPDMLSGLIWVQTVCKGYQQTTKVVLSSQRVKYKTACWYLFWLKPWLKLISFGSNLFDLANVMSTTNSEPGLAVLDICKQVLWQRVKTQFKCRIMRHFIRVCIVCKR